MGNEFDYTAALIGAEIFSLMIGLILLLGCRVRSSRKSRRSFWFMMMVLVSMIGCLSDGISWILDGNAGAGFVLYLTSIISMVMTMVLMGTFYSYLTEYICERKKISHHPEKIGWAAVAAGIAAIIAAALKGNLFYFDNGSFCEGPLYPLYIIFNASYILIGISVLIAYRKELNFYEKAANCAYMVISLIPGITSVFADIPEFTYPALIISLLILYVMLQSDHVKVLEDEKIIIDYKATHDGLTGLYNRRAYLECLERVKAEKESCGVIFGDLNGLKFANDNFGHEAGDQLLIRYAELLKEHFLMEEIYRISGDEFICIAEDVSEAAFRKRALELESILNREQPPLACTGTAYGSSAEIETMVRDAETRMYAEKEIVHAHYPKTRR